MSVQTREHTVDWVTASPLWTALIGPSEPDTAAKSAMRRPALLRFHSDRFMEELQDKLAHHPEQLADNVARVVSFRTPPPGAPAGWVPDGIELKLFQPIHGDFNLVAATLACPRPGLPEHRVNAATGERASFVLRRMSASGAELAWLAGGRTWATASNPPAADEERLPLFAVPYADHDLIRTFFVGLVPTSSRDTFQNAGPAAMTPTAADRTTTPEDPRLYMLRVKVARPLDDLFKSSGGADVRAASALLFVDLADFLRTQVPLAWGLIQSHAPVAQHPGSLYAKLDAKTVSGLPWTEALRRAWDQRMAICGEAATAPAASLDLSGNTAFTGVTLLAAVEAELPTTPAASTPPDPGDTTFEAGAGSAAIPKLTGDAKYIIRCVYERPNCPDPPVISNQTAEFRIGGFFDLDAPARRIHIAMPVDTSIADLRKFKKNVSIALSDQLKQQMSRVGELKDMAAGSAEPGDGLDVGMLCSFSIPIITICALVVLMIFLALLNIIFWWLPFFRICFPISLKSRK